MKKLYSVISAILVLFTLISLVPRVETNAAYGYLPGDANDDGDVTSKDVLLTRRYIAGLEDARDIDAVAADVNTDDDVTSKDVLVMRRFIAGLDDLEGNNEDGKYKVSKISVGGKNISRFTVVLSEDADPCLEYASEIFVDRINRACGYKLNVTRGDADGYAIKFSHDPAYGWESFRVFVDDDGDLEVVSGTKDRQRGAIYAVYHLLEEFVGYRFLMCDDYGCESELDVNGKRNGNVVYLYKADAADIPACLDETVEPFVKYREIAQEGKSYETMRWLHINDDPGGGPDQARYGWRVGTLYMHAHSYAYQMAGPDKMYAHQWIEEQGLHDTQPCLTSDETYEKIIVFNSALVDQRAVGGWQICGLNYTQVSCSPNDNTNFCRCENCKKVYAEEGSIAGTVFRLANRVDEYMGNRYPGIETYTIAYWDARRPPKYTRPRDSVCVCYCIAGCNNHPYDNVGLCEETGGNVRLQQRNWDGTTRNSTNVDDMAYYREWQEISDNIQIWYYSTAGGYFLAPAPNVFNIYNDLKFLVDTGTTGVYFEGNGAKFSFEYLKGYLATRMMWDPFMTEEEFNDLINEFLMICYGEGWTYIREYLEMSNRAGDLQGCWINNFDRPWNQYNEEYFRDNYHYMASLFDKAYEAAANDAERERILDIRMQCDFLGLSATYERDYANGDAETRAEYLERYTALYNRVVLRQVRVAGVNPGHFTGCDNFPADCKEEHLICPMRWIMDDFDGYWHYINGRWI